MAAAAGRHVSASSPAEPLGELLSTSRWRLRVAIHVPCQTPELEVPSHVVGQAESLRDSLQRAGLPCWLVGADEWQDHRLMADVCITVCGLEPPRNLRPPLRSDMVNVLWLVDPQAKAPAQWHDAQCLVTESMPQARWLQEEMEKRIGSSFSPP
jgi:hypothetical protein